MIGLDSLNYVALVTQAALRVIELKHAKDEGTENAWWCITSIGRLGRSRYSSLIKPSSNANPNQRYCSKLPHFP